MFGVLPQGTIPGLIVLFIVIGVIALIGGSIGWLFHNPLYLVLTIAIIGGGIFLVIKRRRARMV
jgi:phosphate starvation-inducible membrane PsiE